MTARSHHWNNAGLEGNKDCGSPLLSRPQSKYVQHVRLLSERVPVDIVPPRLPV